MKHKSCIEYVHLTGRNLHVEFLYLGQKRNLEGLSIDIHSAFSFLFGVVLDLDGILAERSHICRLHSRDPPSAIHPSKLQVPAKLRQAYSCRHAAQTDFQPEIQYCMIPVRRRK